MLFFRLNSGMGMFLCSKLLIDCCYLCVNIIKLAEDTFTWSQASVNNPLTIWASYQMGIICKDVVCALLADRHTICIRINIFHDGITAIANISLRVKFSKTFRAR